MVLRVCRALVGPIDADDAWSETFLAALRAYPDLAPGSNIVGWLATIAHRKSIDQLRTTKRSPVPVASVGDRAEICPRDEHLDDDLRTDLAALAPKQRAAVVYHHLIGLPYVEVGAILGCSEAAARRSAADGIAKLRTTYRRGTSHDHHP